MNTSYLNAKDFGASGSEYSTYAKSTKDQNTFILDDIGDFKVRDEVYLTGCNIHLEGAYLFERKDMKVKNRRPWIHTQPLLDRVEIRGYDGSQGDWVVYFIDIYPEAKNTFRWSKNYGRDWTENVEITDGFIKLDEKVEIKINDFKEREYGCTAVFIFSSRMVSFIEKIEGNEIQITSPANISTQCKIMHSDSAAIQRTIDEAILQNKNVFLPNGKYRLSYTLHVNDCRDLVFEGESGESTILDNSIGSLGIERQEGSCFYVNGGDSFTLKNLFMIGNLGFEDRDLGANLFCRGGTSVYGFYFHKTNATCFKNTKRVLVENCHARKMSAECFYSMGTMREKAVPSDNYTHSITYLRCSVEDCARNAFNNNDKSERVSILYCRIKDVGNASWEGASRFTVIQGCYINNAGCIAIGNQRRRAPELDRLGTGQHIISDNHFERRTTRGTEAMIKIGSFASQVIIKGNNFVNFNSYAIEICGEGQSVDTPPENVIISGNCIDLTAIDDESIGRYGIRITSNFVTVSDNQIYTRGESDNNVKGIIISDDVTMVNVHDNTISGCGVGIETILVKGIVGDIIDERTFYRMEGLASVALKPMLLRTTSHGYKGWNMRWISDSTESKIEEFDPYELTFKLKTPRKLTTGEEFYIYPSNVALRSIHHNLINNCNKPMNHSGFFEKISIIKDNIIL